MRRAKVQLCPRCQGQIIVGTDNNWAAQTVRLDPRQVRGGRWRLWWGPTIHRPAVTPARGYELHDCKNPCPVLDLSKKEPSSEPMF